MAAHLNELAVQPEAPPRNNRKQAQVNNTPASASNHIPSSANHTPGSTNNQSSSQASGNILDPLIDSESDSEPEDNGRGRNDGTLLASDPPKPL